MKKGRVPAPVCLLSGGDGYWTSYACKMLTAAVPAEDRDLRVDALSDPSVSEILLSVSLPSKGAGCVLRRSRYGQHAGAVR